MTATNAKEEQSSEVEMDTSRHSPLFYSYVKIALVVAAYWFVSIALVFINKYLLSSSELKLDAPLFVTWFQCVISVLLCVLLNAFSIVKAPITSETLNHLKELVPLSVTFVGMVTFNNLCLKYVDVSFYYIGRSLTTVFNVVLSYVILKQKTSSPALICCSVIVGGFLLGIDQENAAGSLSFVGVLFGVLASGFVALYSIYIKKMLPNVHDNVVLLTFYNNINAVIMFLPLIALNGEYRAISSFEHLSSRSFWSLMFVSGIFGFAISFLVSLQVKVTSPLTNNISGTAKACAQTVIAAVWYKEPKYIFWWSSNGIVLLGSLAYTRVRHLEMRKEHLQSKSLEEEKPRNPV